MLEFVFGGARAVSKKIFVDRNFFIIALMVEMGIFTALALFLKPYIYCELF